MSVSLEIDEKEREARLSLPRSAYSESALNIAAHVFDGRAEVYLAREARSFELALKPKFKAACLKALAGEFLNELLNQEYRLLVAKFNENVSRRIVTQALLAARGGENPPPPPEGEDAPEFQAEVKRLLAEAEEEIRRTMPKKIAPQGTPLPAWDGEARV